MSTNHLRNVRGLPCVVCGAVKSDPHHLMRGLPPGERGMSRTASDRFAIPLCRMCHDALHADKRADDEAWLAERGIQGRDVAAALWTYRADPRRMLQVIARRLSERGILLHV